MSSSEVFYQLSYQNIFCYVNSKQINIKIELRCVKNHDFWISSIEVLSHPVEVLYWLNLAV